MHSVRPWLLGLAVAALLCAQDWQNATNLPSVDFTGLNAGQKALVLKILRGRDCPCGCTMKIAECRVKDPNCSYSKGLAAAAIEAVKKGGGEAQALAAMDASPLAHPKVPKTLEDPVSIPTEGDPFTGPANAPVTLIEFSDFQCPYCGKAVEELRVVLRAYPTQVKLVYKQFPLDQHSQAALAAAASLAAHRQGKFWPLHDAMYADRTHLSRQTIEAMAAKIGLDMKRFGQDWASPATRDAVMREMEQGERAGVQGTPSIFVDGRKYNGSLELDAISKIIDAELKGKNK